MFIPKEVYRLDCRSRQRRHKEICVITTDVLCNDNRRKDILTKHYFSVMLFCIACISNPYITSACLLDMVLMSFFGLGNSL